MYDYHKMELKKMRKLIMNIKKYKLLNKKTVEELEEHLILYTKAVIKKEREYMNEEKIMGIIKKNFDEFKNELLLLNIKLIIKIIRETYMVANPRLFGYTIPDYFIIKKIKKLAENKCILEIGAGCGLWAALLQKINVNIIPTDIERQKIKYTKIKRCDNMMALEKYNCEILMLSWPDINNDMAYETLKGFKKKLLIYIGEPKGCACANDNFFNLLKNKWKLLYSEFIIPFWYDESYGKLENLRTEHKIYIYKRK